MCEIDNPIHRQYIYNVCHKATCSMCALSYTNIWGNFSRIYVRSPTAHPESQRERPSIKTVRLPNDGGVLGGPVNLATVKPGLGSRPWQFHPPSEEGQSEQGAHRPDGRPGYRMPKLPFREYRELQRGWEVVSRKSADKSEARYRCETLMR